jgi:hypothetical protein
VCVIESTKARPRLSRTASKSTKRTNPGCSRLTHDYRSRRQRKRHQSRSPCAGDPHSHARNRYQLRRFASSRPRYCVPRENQREERATDASSTPTLRIQLARAAIIPHDNVVPQSAYSNHTQSSFSSVEAIHSNRRAGRPGPSHRAGWKRTKKAHKALMMMP